MGAGDARNKIGGAGGKVTDARDVLAGKSKGMDARQKLEKMRNLKDGNLEVKTVGGITVTKKVGGGIVLSTKAASGGAAAAPGMKEVKQIGRLTKTVTSSGQVSLSSKSSREAEAVSPAAGRPGRGVDKPRAGPGMRSRSEGGAGSSVLKGAAGGQKENRAGGRNRDIVDSLDEMLLNTEIEPGLLHRTVETSRRQHVGVSAGRRGRSRSPMGRDRSPARGRAQDYDDPRTADRETEAQRRRARDQRAEEEAGGRTMASRLDSGSMGVSPLQGTKIVIQNLQTSVTQEDILELFGDIGAMRRAKLISPGHAEVTYVNKADASRAVEIYHNRQLDGKPMKCQMVGAGSTVAPGGATLTLPKELQGGKDKRGPQPDIDSIHRALFNKKSAAGKKQTFTITMPKKSKDEQERW